MIHHRYACYIQSTQLCYADKILIFFDTCKIFFRKIKSCNEFSKVSNYLANYKHSKSHHLHIRLNLLSVAHFTNFLLMLRLVSSFINKSSFGSVRRMSQILNHGNLVWMDMEMTGEEVCFVLRLNWILRIKQIYFRLRRRCKQSHSSSDACNRCKFECDFV